MKKLISFFCITSLLLGVAGCKIEPEPYETTITSEESQSIEASYEESGLEAGSSEEIEEESSASEASYLELDYHGEIPENWDYPYLEGELNTALSSLHEFDEMENNQILAMKIYFASDVNFNDVDPIGNLEDLFDPDYRGIESRTALIIPRFVGSDIYIESIDYVRDENEGYVYKVKEVLHEFKNTPADFGILYSYIESHGTPVARVRVVYNKVISEHYLSYNGKGGPIIGGGVYITGNQSEVIEELWDLPNNTLSSSLSTPNYDDVNATKKSMIDFTMTAPFTTGNKTGVNLYEEIFYYNTLEVSVKGYHITATTNINTLIPAIYDFDIKNIEGAANGRLVFYDKPEVRWYAYEVGELLFIFKIKTENAYYRLDDKATLDLDKIMIEVVNSLQVH